MTVRARGPRLLDALLLLAGLCFVVGMGVTVIDVLLRAFAARNVPGAIELTSLSIGLGALLSMPVCYAKRTHVTARLLSEVSPGRFAAPLGILGGVASVIFALMLVWIAATNMWSRLGSPETTADLGLSMSHGAIVIAAALSLGLIAALVSLWALLRRRGTDR